jgi:hypothetical protein
MTSATKLTRVPKDGHEACSWLPAEDALVICVPFVAR